MGGGGAGKTGGEVLAAAAEEAELDVGEQRKKTAAHREGSRLAAVSVDFPRLVSPRGRDMSPIVVWEEALYGAGADKGGGGGDGAVRLAVTIARSRSSVTSRHLFRRHLHLLLSLVPSRTLSARLLYREVTKRRDASPSAGEESAVTRTNSSCASPSLRFSCGARL